MLESSTVVDQVCKGDRRSGGCVRKENTQKQTTSAIYEGKPELVPLCKTVWKIKTESVLLVASVFVEISYFYIIS